MNPFLLSVRDLTVAFRTEHGVFPVVEDVNFDIEHGCCVGIVGESGCGKSATAMSLLRLLPQPTGQILSGSVSFQGKDLLHLPLKQLRAIRGNRIGTIFQEPMQALNPVQRIGDQIAEVLRLHKGMRETEALQEAVRLLDAVQISAPERRVHEYPHSLSGGMRQRVLIAMAVACRPNLIIADEPTTALDVTVQQQILSLLREMRSDLGAACLLITHDMGVVAENCDYVWVMYAGRLVEGAPVRELFSHPCHAYTHALLRSMITPDLPHKTPLYTVPGTVASPRHFVPGCRFCQRLGRTGDTLLQRPSMVEITPSHFVEACPLCTNS